MFERYFDQTEVAVLHDYRRSGLYITAPKLSDVHMQPAGMDGALNVGWRTNYKGNLEQDAIISRETDDVQTIVLSSPQTEFLQTRLAVTFANHLFATRSTRVQTASPPYLVSAAQPQLSEGMVRIPHLAACAKGEHMEDAVMWEMLPKDEAESWLDSSLPDQIVIENHLSELLRLRRDMREHTLPDTPDHQELVRRLEAGRYISILFVYQNIELFDSLFAIKN